MGLLACSECNGVVSSSAASCPHCGAMISRVGGAATNLLKAMLWLVGIAAAIFAAAVVKEIVSPTDLANSPYWAIDEGKKSLEHQLKDASSVEYGDVWAGRVVSDSGRSTMVACGYFNARNSFGGKSGMQRFIGSPGNMVLTDEVPGGELMNVAWQEACISQRVN